MTEIIPYYKPLGLTPLQTIEQLRKERPELATTPITYAGRLDPMAEGLLLLLAGDAVHRKEEFLNLDKTYQAEILCGFSSDTFDILGLAEYQPLSGRISGHHENPQGLLTAVNSAVNSAVSALVGQHEFPYPAYSSKPVAGRPMWQHARSGAISDAKIPRRKMTVLNADVKNVELQTWADIYARIAASIKLVTGDFRQTEILAQWDNLNSKISPTAKFPIVTITFKVTSGTYIRTLANELGKLLNSRALLFSLKRTKIGRYRI